MSVFIHAEAFLNLNTIGTSDPSQSISGNFISEDSDQNMQQPYMYLSLHC